MSLTGIDKLNRSHALTNIFQLLDIREQQIASLIASSAAGKSQRENFLVKVNSGEPAHLAQQISVRS